MPYRKPVPVTDIYHNRYLGLMLGYSAYSIADFVDYIWTKWNRRQLKRENDIREGKRKKRSADGEENKATTKV